MAETTTTAPAQSGWGRVNGFLDGLSGATDRIGGIVDTVADGAEDVARGRAAISEQRLDREQRELDMALQLRGFNRGDNRLMIFAVAAGAVALVMLMR